MNKNEKQEDLLVYKDNVSEKEKDKYNTKHSRNKYAVKAMTFGKKHYETIAIFLLIVMILATIGTIRKSIANGTNSLKDSYGKAFQSERDAAYQKQYDKYFDRAEKQYHVSNRVSISVSGIKESEALEVLKVSDIEFVAENGDSNEHHITSWLEVPGDAVYVVNLQKAEFIVDDQRHYILARIPKPEISSVSIDYQNVKKLLFKNDLFNESIQVGEEQARRQLDQGNILIRKEFASNEYYFKSAQKAAVSSVKSLISGMNPGVDDLTVDVEFI